LLTRAAAGECDLAAHGPEATEARGWLRGSDGAWRSDRARERPVDDAALRAPISASAPRTFTCLPPGTGDRVALDRDGDGALDGDERDAGSDPADPASVPPTCEERVALSKPLLRVARNDEPSGDERFLVRATIADAAALDPSAEGLLLAVRDRDGFDLASRRIAGGAAGWRARAGTTRWTYDGAADGAPGLRARLRGRGSSLVLVVTGRAQAFRVPVESAPLTLTVEIGRASRCAEVRFEGPGAPAPACTTRRRGTLRCR
jgi:hypothetical protein